MHTQLSNELAAAPAAATARGQQALLYAILARETILRGGSAGTEVQRLVTTSRLPRVSFSTFPVPAAASPARYRSDARTRARGRVLYRRSARAAASALHVPGTVA